jgi:hypothetical protein
MGFFICGLDLCTMLLEDETRNFGLRALMIRIKINNSLEDSVSCS